MSRTKKEPRKESNRDEVERLLQMRVRKTKKELRKYVEELCAYARELFPEAKVYAKDPYETEDADIVVELPNRRKGVASSHNALRGRALDILMERGYDIVTFVEITPQDTRKKQAAQ